MAKKLLLADDSVTVQRVIELTFAEEGLEVVAVGSGREAMARFDIDRPDIVLADVSMDDGDGYALAAHVKARAGNEVPVILMTGAFEQLDDDRASEVGCDGVLAKPFEPQMAISLVRELLDRDRTGPITLPVVPDASTSFEVAAPVALETAPGTASGGGSLDDYFDRLDEALASVGYAASSDVPTFDHVAGRTHASTPPPTEAVVATASSDAGPTSLAEAFSVLLSDELGEASLPAAWTAAATARAEPDEAFVDRVAALVAERLADTAIREAVERRVLDLAERLIREEIDRIKTGA